MYDVECKAEFQELKDRSLKGQKLKEALCVTYEANDECGKKMQELEKCKEMGLECKKIHQRMWFQKN